MQGGPNHYEILGVSPRADSKAIRTAYRALIAQHHPDRSGSDDEMAKAINEAFAVLGNAERRARYDEAMGFAVTYGEAPKPDAPIAISKVIRPSSAGYLVLFTLAAAVLEWLFKRH